MYSRPPEPKEVTTEKANAKAKIDTAIISAGVNYSDNCAEAFFVGVGTPKEALATVFALHNMANDIQAGLENQLGIAEVQELLARLQAGHSSITNSNVMRPL